MRCGGSTRRGRSSASRCRAIGKSRTWRPIAGPRRMWRCGCISRIGGGRGCRSTSGPASGCRGGRRRSRCITSRRRIHVFGAAATTPNVLRLLIDPEEGIDVQFAAKQPGPEMSLGRVVSSMRYKDYFDEKPNVGYETLLYDCMLGRYDAVPAGGRDRGELGGARGGAGIVGEGRGRGREPMARHQRAGGGGCAAGGGWADLDDAGRVDA